jgi:predicted dehydrogenase
MRKQKQTLKLGIIGGSIESAVGYTHLIASQMDHRWKLVSACFSRRKEINHATVEAWNLHHIRLYSDWQALLEGETNKIDAIVILTPTPQHRDMVIKGLSLGYAVICEKALASDYQEGIEICETLEKTKGFLAVTHNYTGYPMLRELRSMVQQGQLGQLTQIQIEMPQEGFARLDTKGNKPSPQTWRLHDGKIPSVSLDLGAHLQHMIHYISNENPTTLIADQHSYGWFHEVIDDVSCIAHYPSGMKSDMWFGKAAIGYRNGLKIRVFGTQGSAEWYQMEPEVLFVHDIYGNKKWVDRAADVQLASELRYNRFKSGHPAGFVEAFANLYYDIADKLEDYQETKIYDKHWTYGALQATIGLNVLETMNHSAKEQKWLILNKT